MDEPGSVVIRDAVPADLPGVARIYAWQTQHGYATFDTEPRPSADWREHLDGPHPFLVAVRDDVVLGFAYAGAFRSRPAYHRTVETTVYLDREAIGHGLGGRLYDVLLERLRAEGRHTALAMIALPNPASVGLHESRGYVPAGTLRQVGDKLGRLIDVGVWQLLL